MIFGFVMDTAAQEVTTDSVFVRNSRPIEFIVNKINISDDDRRWITNSLIPALKALGDRESLLVELQPRLRVLRQTT